MEEIKKVCIKCKEEKESFHFAKDNKCKSKTRNVCRTCNKNRMREILTCGIYKITSPSNKVYIGQSVGIEYRISSYKKEKGSVEGQVRLYNSLKKHGWVNHSFEIIEECLEEDLNCRERHWQEFYDVVGENGLNCSLTQCGEARKVYSDDYLKRKSLNSMGDKNPNFGKPMKEHVRKVLSDFNIGRKDTPQQLEFKSQKMKGEGNIMFGKKCADHPTTKKVINIKNLIVYNCTEEVSELLGIKTSLLNSYFSGRRTNKTDFVYLKDYEENPNLVIIKECYRYIELTTGIKFKNMKEISEYKNIQFSKIKEMLREDKKATENTTGIYRILKE